MNTRDRVYAFVHTRLRQGHPPTVREVQQALGFSAVQSAQEHLEALVAAGRLKKLPGQSRGYRLPEQPPALHFVPILGRVQAGALTEAIQDPEGYLPITAKRSGTFFALRVRGASMTGAGILEGDLVVVRRQPNAESGEIVVALIDNEATVKTLRRRRGYIELAPENPAFKPILIEPPAELTLLGKVIEVHRYLA